MGGRRRRGELPLLVYISILAPAWGASPSLSTSSRSRQFQFSPPRGGRPTSTSRTSTSTTLFQFSPPRGGRLRFVMYILLTIYFNSRPRVGGVPRWPGRCRRLSYFNSRPRVGGVDLAALHIGHGVLISILAPAWGASGAGVDGLVVVDISILAPAWGASRLCSHLSARSTLFPFSPPRGGRLPPGVVRSYC